MGYLLAAMVLTLGPQVTTGPAKEISPSERLASALMKSRKCEVVPENNYTYCTYRYRGLVLVHRVIGNLTPFLEVTRLAPPLTVTYVGGPCVQISIPASNPDDVAFVQLSVRDGKLYMGNPPECMIKAHSG